MNRRRKETPPKSLLVSLDKLIEEHHLLKHPFYKAWGEGTLSKESLQLYAVQYYQHVRAFPNDLKKLSERAIEPIAALVRENFAEEMNPAAPRALLWRQFAQSLGVSESDMDAARPLPGIAALLDTFDEVATQGTMAEVAAVFYAYEAQVPETAAQKIDGLRRFYNVTDPRALAYFAVHEESDLRHRDAWRSWLASQTEIDKFAVLCSAERSLKVVWGALDSVYPQTCAATNN